jgi:hypothetical protein
MRYYDRFREQYATLVPKATPGFCHAVDTGDKVALLLTMVIFPVSLIVSADLIRDEIKKSVEQNGTAMKEWLEEYVGEVESQLKCA